MADLFLSYAREDRDAAEALARALYNRGWTVWWDRRIPPGQTFSEVIERELGAARCVIVLWSRNSLNSDWVKNEAAEAAARRALVPVRIENVTPPFEFRRIQAADLFNWQSGFGGPDFDACLAAIERLVRRTAEVAMPRQPAPQPQPQQPLPQHAPPQRPPVSVSPATAAVASFMIPAVLVTIGCCPIFGIVAIVYASQVNTKLAAGDTAGALLASKQAKMWSVIGFVAGLVLCAIYLIILGSQ
jgi:hypothetical protein